MSGTTSKHNVGAHWIRIRMYPSQLLLLLSNNRERKISTKFLCPTFGIPLGSWMSVQMAHACPRSNLGVLSHHLKCEMKSPHLVDFS